VTGPPWKPTPPQSTLCLFARGRLRVAWTPHKASQWKEVRGCQATLTSRVRVLGFREDVQEACVPGSPRCASQKGACRRKAWHQRRVWSLSHLPPPPPLPLPLLCAPALGESSPQRPQWKGVLEFGVCVRTSVASGFHPGLGAPVGDACLQVRYLLLLPPRLRAPTAPTPAPPPAPSLLRPPLAPPLPPTTPPAPPPRPLPTAMGCKNPSGASSSPRYSRVAPCSASGALTSCSSKHEHPSDPRTSESELHTSKFGIQTLLHTAPSSKQSL